MFDDVLSYFADFPQVEIRFYSYETTYDAGTGKLDEAYAFDYNQACWGFQRSAAQSFVRGREFDDVDMVFILDTLPPNSDIMYYDGLWYTVAYPDNIGFSGVYTIGAKRTDKPKLSDDEVLMLDNYEATL